MDIFEQYIRQFSRVDSCFPLKHGHGALTNMLDRLDLPFETLKNELPLEDYIWS